ncbi:MAG: NAD(+)/NADH kinase [Armatimonadetes bacterium]|nr:NAD(+)/NADH kinase [Armatimonadota bacterium]
MPPSSALIVFHPSKPDAVAASQKAQSKLLQFGASVQSVSQADAAQMTALPEGIDFVVSLGGDGTLLTSAHLAAPAGAPIFGAHFGRFGFVAQVRPNELEMRLDQALKGDCSVQSRVMVSARGTEAPLYGLNEVAIYRQSQAPLLEFGIVIDGVELSSYPADGIIVSTPTGSTAYSLSVGGPVVDPTVEALTVVSISPHTLSIRPLMLPATSKIEVKVLNGGRQQTKAVRGSRLTADGARHQLVQVGESVEISRAPFDAKIIVFEKGEFIDKLRNRLQWGARVNE